jgi:hypothetical protein
MRAPATEQPAAGAAAHALTAFLTWRATPADAAPMPLRSVVRSLLVGSAVCLVLGVLSFVAPLVAPGGNVWSAGARLLLLCHLG